jgi:hypothetical protein
VSVHSLCSVRSTCIARPVDVPVFFAIHTILSLVLVVVQYLCSIHVAIPRTIRVSFHNGDSLRSLVTHHVTFVFSIRRTLTSFILVLVYCLDTAMDNSIFIRMYSPCLSSDASYNSNVAVLSFSSLSAIVMQYSAEPFRTVPVLYCSFFAVRCLVQ